ncbi:MAG TPA: Tim44/TimA family putative adaptor protein [Hyphomicrobiales bacterium]|nr:Tim44/TimA family putative adaptor protein [Hyphomicrobiales bacterium]
MNGFLDIYTILFLVIAVVIFIRLRSVLGRRTGHERPPFDPYTRPEGPAGDAARNNREKVVQLPKRSDKSVREEEAPDRWKGFARTGSSLARTLSAIAEIDPRFDPRKFLEGAKTAYEMIVTAFAAGDRKTLEPLLGREVYDGFVEAISAREKRGETIASDFIGIEKAEIVDGALKGTMAQLTVKFVSELISVTRSKSGEVIEGDPKAIREVTDIWTFARDLASPNPNWKLVATEAAS